jgi:hypothetical protein
MNNINTGFSEMKHNQSCSLVVVLLDTTFHAALAASPKLSRTKHMQPFMAISTSVSTYFSTIRWNKLTASVNTIFKVHVAKLVS